MLLEKDDLGQTTCRIHSEKCKPTWVAHADKSSAINEKHTGGSNLLKLKTEDFGASRTISSCEHSDKCSSSFLLPHDLWGMHRYHALLEKMGIGQDDPGNNSILNTDFNVLC